MSMGKLLKGLKKVFSREAPAEPVSKPDVYVIIPAYNEEKWIGKTIESVKGQNYDGNIKTVVVENGSTDRTASVANDHGVDEVIHTDIRGISHAKNLGVRSVKKDAKPESIYIFNDADTLMEDNVVDSVYRKILTGNRGGKVRLIPSDDKRMRARFFSGLDVTLNKAKVWKPASKLGIYPGWGATTYTTKEYFDELGGFDENKTSLVDLDFFGKMLKSGDYGYVSDAKVHSSMRSQLKNGYMKPLWRDIKNGVKNFITHSKGKYKEREWVRDVPSTYAKEASA